MKRMLTLLLALAAVAPLRAQKYPERSHVRSGNRHYHKQEYVESEVEYRRALEKNPASAEAAFNLGDALFREERFADAAQLFSAIAQDSTRSAEMTAQALYNRGNALLAEQKLQEALEAYKQSLRINPSDMEAKYNLAYVKKLLEQQQNDQNNQNDRNNQDNNQDNDRDNRDNRNGGQNGDGENDDKRQNPERNDPGNDGQNPDKPDDSDSNGAQQPPRNAAGGISEAEAERMLEAMQNEEDKTRDKVNKRKAATVGKSGKNW